MSEPLSGVRQAEEWVRAGENAFGIGFWSWSVADGRFTASSGLCTLVGINPASVRLDLVFLESLVHPEDRLAIEDTYALAIDARQAARRFRVIRPDGQLRWIEAETTSFFDRAGQITKVVAAWRDTTDDHSQRQCSSNMRALLHNLSRLTGAAFWIATQDGQLIERFNANEELDLAGSLASAPSWKNVVHPEDAARIPASWTQAMTRRSYRFDARILMADGQYRMLHAAGLPFDARFSSEPHWGGISATDERKLSRIETEENPVLLLNPGQVRACRALLDWNAEVLAAKAGISVSTVRRLESNEVSSGQGDSMRLVMIAFREAGLRIWMADDGRFCVSDAH